MLAGVDVTKAPGIRVRSVEGGEKGAKQAKTKSSALLAITTIN